MKAIRDNFSVEYLLFALFCEKEQEMVNIILNTYGYISKENIKELMIDYISYKKIDIFGDEYE